MKNINKLIYSILEQQSQTIVKNQKGNVYPVLNTTAQKGFKSHKYTVPTQQQVKNSEQTQQKDDGVSYDIPTKQLQHVSNVLKTSKQYIDKNGSQDDISRFDEFSKHFSTIFSNKATKKDKLYALKYLSENSMIQINNDNIQVNQKLYIGQNISGCFKDKTVSGLASYKSAMTGEKTKPINDIIKFALANGIDIPVKGGATSRAQGDLNQKGVVHNLDPSETNKKDYENSKRNFQNLGGKVDKVQKINNDLAQTIKTKLDGKKIVKAMAVGDSGKAQLTKLGIDNKSDPTDFVVFYQDDDGKTKMMKISAKIYMNVNSIVMKNDGLSNAASHYFGQKGKQIDKMSIQLKKKHDFSEKGISIEQQNSRLKDFRQGYLKAIHPIMEEASNSEQGQKELLNMWRSIHGCGKDVYTSVANMKTGEVQLRDPDYYCKPKMPFKVTYNKNKIVVNMAQQGSKFLELTVFSVQGKSPSFRSTTRTLAQKKEKSTKQRVKKTKKNQSLKSNHNNMIKAIVQLLNKGC